VSTRDGTKVLSRPTRPARDDAPSRPRALLQRASDISWRLLLVGLLVLAVGAVLWRLRLVILPVFVAMLLCAALVPLVTRLEGKGVPTLAATWLVYLGFLALVIGTIVVIVPLMASELNGVGERVNEGLDDVEDWLVDGPLNLDRSDVEGIRPDGSGGAGKISETVSKQSSTIVSGAIVVGELVAGLILALILGFLLLKDGRKFQAWALGHLPERQHELACALSQRAWAALAGYLRGAAILGVVEGLIIGITLWIVGVPLAAPIGVLTFLAAFFPIVGAFVAGASATLVALATAGTREALIVLAVCVVVQQLDNDLLAPFIYGKSVQLHPAVILVALTTGSVLGGIIGAFLAVPISAAVSGVSSELWGRYGEAWRSRPDDPGRPRGNPLTGEADTTPSVP
jgi:predicted PurR-regulated permease PerM